MMSIEKFIVLYFPFKARNICTVRTAKWASGIAFIIFFLLNLFWFWDRSLESDIHSLLLKTFLWSFFLNWERIDGVIYSFGPFAIIGLANIAIIYKFVQAKLTNRRCGSTESTKKALGNAAHEGNSHLDYCDHDLHNTHCSCSNLFCNYT